MKRWRTFKILIIILLIICSLTTDYAFGDSVEKYFYQGVTNYEAGNLEQAIADYSKAIALNPNYAAAYHNRGRAYYILGELENAHQDLERSLELAPDTPDREAEPNVIEKLVFYILDHFL